MKKIGFVIPWYADNIPGGAEMELRGLTQHLADSGIELEIIATCVEKFGSDWNVDYYPEGIENVKGINVRRFKVRKRDTETFDAINYKFMNGIPVSLQEEEIFLREMVNSPDMYEYIERHKPEYALFVFIPYMFGTTYYGLERCLEKAVLIPCLHDESYAYMTSFKARFSKVKGMILHSKAEYELAHKIYDLSAVTVSNLGEGVDTELTYDSERFRKKYGIYEPFIIYAGRKDVGKNVHTLLEYFQRYIIRNKTNLKLVLIGGGSITIPETAKNEIIDLGYIPIQDKYDAMASSVYLCNPSKFESFSLIIMESWLCERPVLVYGGCDVTKKFVIESNGGLYFNSYAEFEKCTSYMLEHRDVSFAMGQNGRQYVLQNFAWDVIVKKYIDFFEKCCEK